MSGSRRAAVRLLQLAGADPQLAGALLPLLERLELAVAEGREPLPLQPHELPLLQGPAADLWQRLPVAIEPTAGGLPQLWTRAAFHRRERLLLELEQRLIGHGGCLVTGGAGTGKTTLVRELLQPDQGRRVALAAPTGKAAARLRQALGSAAEPWVCQTLHRLLEARGSGDFGRDSHRPLALDTLVVDEVSMVDGRLMEALLQALPGDARLLLVGDAGQLPPVGGGGLLDALEQRLERSSPGHRRHLTVSHRFDDSTALGRFVTALRHPADPGALQQQLASLPADANLRWHPLQRGLPPPLLRLLQDHVQTLRRAAAAADAEPTALLALLDRVLLLAPQRRGPLGVNGLNSRLLGIDPQQPRRWPAGTPVLVTRNDPDLDLANGDLGLVLRQGSNGGPEVLLPGPQGPRRLPLALLPGLEPALALTVHKSQGSQADRAVVVVPQPDGLDPRLLYTALTRARQQVDLLCPPLEPPAPPAGGPGECPRP
ncbi:MAG: AAA family ATPase [Synechococcus sp. Tobar2m-G35]|nr:AAA family ATPase [Synechococcus sp. Tobar2m-G35]